MRMKIATWLRLRWQRRPLPLPPLQHQGLLPLRQPRPTRALLRRSWGFQKWALPKQDAASAGSAHRRFSRTMSGSLTIIPLSGLPRGFILDVWLHSSLKRGGRKLPFADCVASSMGPPCQIADWFKPATHSFKNCRDGSEPLSPWAKYQCMLCVCGAVGPMGAVLSGVVAIWQFVPQTQTDPRRLTS